MSRNSKAPHCSSYRQSERHAFSDGSSAGSAPSCSAHGALVEAARLSPLHGVPKGDGTPASARQQPIANPAKSPRPAPNQKVGAKRSGGVAHASVSAVFKRDLQSLLRLWNDSVAPALPLVGTWYLA